MGDESGVLEFEYGGSIAFLHFEVERHIVACANAQVEALHFTCRVIGCEGNEYRFAVGCCFFGYLCGLSQGFGKEEGVGLEQFVASRVGECEFVGFGLVDIHCFAVVGGFHTEYIEQEAVAVHGELSVVGNGLFVSGSEGNGEVGVQDLLFQGSEQSRESGQEDK